MLFLGMVLHILVCLWCFGTIGEAKDDVSDGGYPFTFRRTASGHPIEKVITMLEDLKTKSLKEGRQEAIAYQKFVRWSSETRSTLEGAIEEEKSTTAGLEDLLSGVMRQNETLMSAIVALEEQIGDMDSSDSAAQKQREKEKLLWTKQNMNLKESIQATHASIDILKKAAGMATSQGVLLAQKSVDKVIEMAEFNPLAAVGDAAKKLPIDGAQDAADKLRKILDKKDQGTKNITVPASKDEDSPDGKAGSSSEAPQNRSKLMVDGDLAAHRKKPDFEAEQIIEFLKDLKTRFEEKKIAVTKAEINAQNAFNVRRAAYQNAREKAQKSLRKKTAAQAKVASTIATTRISLQNEKDNLEVDSKTLRDTKERSATKQAEWEERSNVRDKEIAAIGAAVEILSQSTGVRTEAPDNPALPASPASLLSEQEGSTEAESQGQGYNFLQIQAEDSPGLRAIALLHKTAEKTHSKALERAAVEIKAHLGGGQSHQAFRSIANMIDKMILRLMDDQTQDDEHKRWCDKELSKSWSAADEKESSLRLMRAQIKSETAAIAMLHQAIIADMEMVNATILFMNEATETRRLGRAESEAAIKDTESAQRALGNAIAVLRDFYQAHNDASNSHGSLPSEPTTWSSGYTGVADVQKQPSGIISVLEEVMTDFAKMAADTKSQEIMDEQEYEQAMIDNKLERTRRMKDSEMKADESKSRANKVLLLRSEEKRVTNEYETSKQYLHDLMPACNSGDSTYEERKAARTEEEDALRTAKAILSAEPTELVQAATKGKLFLDVRRHELGRSEYMPGVL